MTLKVTQYSLGVCLKVVIIATLLFAQIARAQENNWLPANNPEDRRHSIFVYHGWMTEAKFIDLLRFYRMNTHEGSRQYSIEYGYRLSNDNWLKNALSWLAHDIDLAFNYTRLNDIAGPIDQFNPHIQLIWNRFPWDNILLTHFAIGEGFSWSSQIPSRELTTNPKTARRLLNYLMVEAGVALPQHPNLQFVYRVHHRSGVFGLYTPGTPGTVGSNVIGFGIRYRF